MNEFLFVRGQPQSEPKRNEAQKQSSLGFSGRIVQVLNLGLTIVTSYLLCQKHADQSYSRRLRLRTLDAHNL